MLLGWAVSTPNQNERVYEQMTVEQLKVELSSLKEAVRDVDKESWAYSGGETNTGATRAKNALYSDIRLVEGLIEKKR